MSNIACKKEDRNTIIYAEIAKEENIDTEYYCPNNECDARLKIYSRNGLMRPHFRADREHKHIENCPYGSNIISKTDYYKYNQEKFDFDRAIENMFHINNQRNNNENIENDEINNNPDNSKPISTIKQIYAMCKNTNVRDKYANIEICKMLVDNRSMFFYINGIFGNKIVECKVRGGYYYSKEKQEVYLYIENYKLVLHFNDNRLFDSIKRTIWNNKSKTIIVAGNWKKIQKDNVITCHTTIVTRKQLGIIK
ncbi:hypothetical protein [Capnocytophaga leadbetteri]